MQQEIARPDACIGRLGFFTLNAPGKDDFLLASACPADVPAIGLARVIVLVAARGTCAGLALDRPTSRRQRMVGDVFRHSISPGADRQLPFGELAQKEGVLERRNL
ncbi:hypothetical protein D0839_14755 [Bordetella avium]|uniref:Uncharacterized protein n=1 Tax=Bordetella avium (strain 197N) TaxID=360910 RepID=Q2KVW2_BORA1|nr:hypothetical protein C0J07_04295 [Bordetella avium]CAJ48520.1 hypothetical protein BAV0910 [Bordetella avium 197N]RIQ13332.1 hypothetical protein D0432_08800 [Bordetella avium]RIQ16413.1 hypothetical protein D0850_15010 [Bordetella avium]RIQ31099.1 hypothetical protein D0849_15115 [Bordetella avium]